MFGALHVALGRPFVATGPDALETLRITNEHDLALARRGLLLLSQVRTIDVQARVDTGAAMLVLPSDIVDDLGLTVAGYRNLDPEAAHVDAIPWVTGVKVELRGREAVVSALVGPSGSTPVIGRASIDDMGFVFDPASDELRPNPKPQG